MTDNVARLSTKPAATVHCEPDSKVSMRAEHVTALGYVAEEAAKIAAAATRIVQSVQETNTRSGVLAIQPQVQFLAGTQTRLLKDWGVIEHLQAHGANVHRHRQ